MKKIKVKKSEIYYNQFTVSKSKWTFLILHWWWGLAEPWTNVAKWLQGNGYNVIVPDLPGFWKTKLDKVYDIYSYADMVKDFCIALKLKEVYLIWHSNWWRIAIVLSAKNMIKIKKLFLVASAWIPRKPWIKQKIAWSLAKISKWMLKFLHIEKSKMILKIRNLFYRAIWWHDYLNAEDTKMKKTFLNVFNTDFRKEIKCIKDDTILLWWTKDTYTPLANWEEMSRLIKNSRLIVFKWERHWLHRTMPEKLAEDICLSLY